MSESSSAPSNYPCPVPCESIVYRIASKSSWFNRDSGEMVSGAFLRYRKDKEGLSLALGEVDTCEKASHVLQTAHAVASLHAGRVRAVEDATYTLDVMQDQPSHGFIGGLPYENEDTIAAERLATRLLAQSRLCWSKRSLASEGGRPSIVDSADKGEGLG